MMNGQRGEEDEDYGRRAARASFATRALLILTIALLSTVLYLLTSLSADTNQIVSGVQNQQNSNSDRLDIAQQTLDRVVDCTEPSGKCFRDGQARTADAVATISRVSIYASACAADHRLLAMSLEKRAHSIQRCVNRLLDEGR